MNINSDICLSDKEYHITTSDGVVLYAHVRGSGEPCLYLHGGPGAGSTVMKDLGGSVLESRYTMIYLDQRGVCRSSYPTDNNFSLARQVLDFEEVRMTLGFEEWFLLGHSFGGILEMAYWRESPQSIKGMMFEDCTLSVSDSFKDSLLPAAIEIIGEENADPIAKNPSLPIMTRIATVQQQLANSSWNLIFTCENNRRICDAVNSGKYRVGGKAHGNGGIVLGLDEYWEDFRTLTPTVTVPVLFFVGRYDRAIGPESYKGVHFPIVLVKLGNCGHYPFAEAPAEWAGALDEYGAMVRTGANARLQ